MKTEAEKGKKTTTDMLTARAWKDTIKKVKVAHTRLQLPLQHSRAATNLLLGKQRPNGCEQFA